MMSLFKPRVPAGDGWEPLDTLWGGRLIDQGVEPVWVELSDGRKTQAFSVDANSARYVKMLLKGASMNGQLRLRPKFWRLAA